MSARTSFHEPFQKPGRSFVVWIGRWAGDSSERVSGTPPSSKEGYSAKTRYRQTDAACRIGFVEDERLVVEFETPQRAVTPGQSVVLYRREECLGGAIIDAAVQTERMPAGGDSLTARHRMLQAAGCTGRQC